MVKIQLLISLAIAVVVLSAVGAEKQGSSDSGDSGFSSSDSDPDSSADDPLGAATIGSGSFVGNTTIPPETLAPSSTALPVAQPIADGVKMFGQCGGIFYSGTTACYDPDAYCKELSIYSSICSPKPTE